MIERERESKEDEEVMWEEDFYQSIACPLFVNISYFAHLYPAHSHCRHPFIDMECRAWSSDILRISPFLYYHHNTLIRVRRLAVVRVHQMVFIFIVEDTGCLCAAYCESLQSRYELSLIR